MRDAKDLLERIKSMSGMKEGEGMQVEGSGSEESTLDGETIPETVRTVVSEESGDLKINEDEEKRRGLEPSPIASEVV